MPEVADSSVSPVRRQRSSPAADVTLPYSPLPRTFYERSVLTVAREALGKLIVVQDAQGATVVVRIVETEAYRGPEDRAAHSWRGRLTPRTQAMFGPAGHAYLFVLYGRHWHLNLVTGSSGEPHAVLIRGAEPVEGLELMAARRQLPATSSRLTNGPGKLCQALGIDRRLYGHDLEQPPLYLAEGPRLPAATSPRIGVPYAGEWAARPWRFFVRGNASVSPTRPQTTPRGPE